MNIRVLHHEDNLHPPTIKTSRFNSYMGAPLFGDDMPRTAEAVSSAIRRMIAAASRILNGQEGRIVITHGYSLPTVDTVQNGLRHVLFTTLIPATEAPDYLDNSHLFRAGAGITFDALTGLGIPVFIHIMRSYAVNGRGITAGEVVRTVVNPNSNANIEVERLPDVFCSTNTSLAALRTMAVTNGAVDALSHDAFRNSTPMYTSGSVALLPLLPPYEDLTGGLEVWWGLHGSAILSLTRVPNPMLLPRRAHFRIDEVGLDDDTALPVDEEYLMNNSLTKVKLLKKVRLLFESAKEECPVAKTKVDTIEFLSTVHGIGILSAAVDCAIDEYQAKISEEARIKTGDCRGSALARNALPSEPAKKCKPSKSVSDILKSVKGAPKEVTLSKAPEASDNMVPENFHSIVMKDTLAKNMPMMEALIDLLYRNTDKPSKEKLDKLNSSIVSSILEVFHSKVLAHSHSSAGSGVPSNDIFATPIKLNEMTIPSFDVACSDEITGITTKGVDLLDRSVSITTSIEVDNSGKFVLKIERVDRENEDMVTAALKDTAVKIAEVYAGVALNRIFRTDSVLEDLLYSLDSSDMDGITRTITYGTSFSPLDGITWRDNPYEGSSRKCVAGLYLAATNNVTPLKIGKYIAAAEAPILELEKLAKSSSINGVHISAASLKCIKDLYSSASSSNKLTAGKFGRCCAYHAAPFMKAMTMFAKSTGSTKLTVPKDVLLMANTVSAAVLRSFSTALAAVARALIDKFTGIGSVGLSGAQFAASPVVYGLGVNSPHLVTPISKRSHKFIVAMPCSSITYRQPSDTYLIGSVKNSPGYSSLMELKTSTALPESKLVANASALASAVPHLHKFSGVNPENKPIAVIVDNIGYEMIKPVYSYALMEGERKALEALFQEVRDSASEEYYIVTDRRPLTAEELYSKSLAKVRGRKLASPATKATSSILGVDVVAPGSIAMHDENPLRGKAIYHRAKLLLTAGDLRANSELTAEASTIVSAMDVSTTKISGTHRPLSEIANLRYVCELMLKPSAKNEGELLALGSCGSMLPYRTINESITHRYWEAVPANMSITYGSSAASMYGQLPKLGADSFLSVANLIANGPNGNTAKIVALDNDNRSYRHMNYSGAPVDTVIDTILAECTAYAKYLNPAKAAERAIHWTDLNAIYNMRVEGNNGRPSYPRGILPLADSMDLSTGLTIYHGLFRKCKKVFLGLHLSSLLSMVKYGVIGNTTTDMALDSESVIGTKVSSSSADDIPIYVKGEITKKTGALKVNTLETNLEREKSKLRKMREEYAKEYRKCVPQLRKSAREIMAVKNGGSGADERTLESLVSRGIIKGARAIADSIAILLPPINIWAGPVIHNIGDIVIDLKGFGTPSPSVKFYNMTPYKERYREGSLIPALDIQMTSTSEERSIDAPHVRSGQACFGNISEALASAYQKADLVSTIMLCKSYLSSVNINDSYGRIIHGWPGVPATLNNLVKLGVLQTVDAGTHPSIYVSEDTLIPVKDISLGLLQYMYYIDKDVIDDMSAPLDIAPPKMIGKAREFHIQAYRESFAVNEYALKFSPLIKEHASLEMKGSALEFLCRFVDIERHMPGESFNSDIRSEWEEIRRNSTKVRRADNYAEYSNSTPDFTKKVILPGRSTSVDFAVKWLKELRHNHSAAILGEEIPLAELICHPAIGTLDIEKSVCKDVAW